MRSRQTSCSSGKSYQLETGFLLVWGNNCLRKHQRVSNSSIIQWQFPHNPSARRLLPESPGTGICGQTTSYKSTGEPLNEKVYYICPMQKEIEEMEYNTTRNHLIMCEYGCFIQKMRRVPAG